MSSKLPHRVPGATWSVPIRAFELPPVELIVRVARALADYDPDARRDREP
ncbi:hypothetical protein ACW9HQ_39580 [Nocardia gipuzkoensis]